MNDLERGERAERLLNDVVFRDAVADAQAELVSAWKSCPDPVEREGLWHQLNALDCLPRQLRIYVDRRKLQERNEK